MEIDFKNVKEIKEDVNLVLFNSKYFSFKDMVFINKVMEELQDVKIQVNVN